eukprot:1018714-Rhodomonas_salina.1
MAVGDAATELPSQRCFSRIQRAAPSPPPKPAMYNPLPYKSTQAKCRLSASSSSRQHSKAADNMTTSRGMLCSPLPNAQREAASIPKTGAHPSAVVTLAMKSTI